MPEVEWKKGIIFILSAVVIIVTFIVCEIYAVKENKRIIQEQETEVEIPEVTENPERHEDTPIPSPGGTDEVKGDINIEINKDILQYIQVSKEDFDTEIQIFANSFGYAGADEAGDMDEMTVNYAGKTVTVPCYIKLGDKKMKFDAIYNRDKRKWHFAPW